MSALLERHKRLSEVQQARFIGYLLGGDVSPELVREVGKALAYAESVHPAGDGAQERPHQALARIARQSRGEGL